MMHSTARTSTLVLLGIAAVAPGCKRSSDDPTPPPFVQTADTCEPGVSDVIDFETLTGGAMVASVETSRGIGPVLVHGTNPHMSSDNAAVVFDSASPSGGDLDLGTPNEAYGGPGQGDGGLPGSAYANDVPLGKVLIVAADLVDLDGDELVDDPQDAEKAGGRVTFDFSAIGPVNLKQITLLDVESGAVAETFDALGGLVASVVAPTIGANGVITLDLGGHCVTSLVVTMHGSGAIDGIALDRPCTASIGDRVWHDLDEDGAQDPGEPGLENISVALIDSAGTEIARTTTDPAGGYSFEGLCAGNYVVLVDETSLPAGFVPSPCDIGSDTYDSECSPAFVSLLLDDWQEATIDFGFVSPGSGRIGDRVWHDLDRDGLQDAGEPGLEGISIRLVDVSGNELRRVTSGPGGAYVFAGLVAGPYTVEVDAETVPNGWAPTDCDAGADDKTDSECSPARVVLATDEDVVLGTDFGYTSSCGGFVGDRVWYDADRDGIQDPGEYGLGGIGLVLRDLSGTIVERRTSRGSGDYVFTGVCAGTYTVEVDPATIPTGFDLTTCEAGGDPDLDSDCSPSILDLASDDELRWGADFGLAGPCSGEIGDFVWHDLDRDGFQDAGEPGMSGIRLFLRDNQGSVFLTAWTQADGSYTFPGLCGGSWRVELDPATLPPGFDETLCRVGGNRALDSDCSPVSVWLDDDLSVDPTIDFGFQTPCEARIGDFVWIDQDGDDLQGPSEPGIEGVRVLLRGADGSTLETFTGPDGLYEFAGLCAGQYSVEIDATTVPAKLDPVRCGVGSDVSIDSDCSPSEARLTSDSQADLTRDFGFGTCGPCSGGVTDLTLRYTFGTAPALVEIQDSQSTVFSAIVEPGESFGFSGSGPNGVFGRKLTILEDGQHAGLLHTDCTQPIGPGLVRGRFEVLAGRSRGGALLCPVDGDLCGGDSRPRRLTLLYTAADCSATSHSQDPAGVFCGGNLHGHSPVQIFASDAEAGLLLWFDGTVAAGETFVVDAAAAGSEFLTDDTLFQIVDHATGATQTVQFHTSCSQPLVPGDRFGSLILLDADVGGPDEPGDVWCATGSEPDLDYHIPEFPHAFWLPGIGKDFAIVDGGRWVERDNGTVTFSGLIARDSDPEQQFVFNVSLSGRIDPGDANYPPEGSPKNLLWDHAYAENGGPIDTSTFWYYESLSGTLIGTAGLQGAFLRIQRFGPAFQVGDGANNKNTRFGGSGWLDVEMVRQPDRNDIWFPPNPPVGDINVDLDRCD